MQGPFCRCAWARMAPALPFAAAELSRKIARARQLTTVNSVALASIAVLPRSTGIFEFLQRGKRMRCGCSGGGFRIGPVEFGVWRARV